MIFGLDVSHHQGGNPNFARARAEGIEFVIIKATEGATFRDRLFAANLAAARAERMIVAAYHYVRDNATAAAQVTNVRQVVPRDVPVIPDVEAGSGTIPRLRDFIYLLREAGYQVPLLYLPRWYWQQIGSPDLRGLPPLWSSRYPDNTISDLRSEWARVPANYWNGYGGLDVSVLQFTSSARVAGYAPLDANAYRGTRDQFAALMGGTAKEGPILKDKLAKTSTDPQVWFGNGFIRRKVRSQKDLTDLQYVMNQEGLDATIRTIDNLTVLGEEFPATATVDLDYNRFVDDVIAGLGAKLTTTWEPTGQSGGPLTMPDLTGRTMDQVQATLAGLGWRGVLTRENGGTTNDPTKLNTIVSSAPPAGAEITTTDHVTVMVATQFDQRG